MFGFLLGFFKKFAARLVLSKIGKEAKKVLYNELDKAIFEHKNPTEEVFRAAMKVVPYMDPDKVTAAVENTFDLKTYEKKAANLVTQRKESTEAIFKTFNDIIRNVGETSCDG